MLSVLVDYFGWFGLFCFVLGAIVAWVCMVVGEVDGKCSTWDYYRKSPPTNAEASSLSWSKESKDLIVPISRRSRIGEWTTLHHVWTSIKHRKLDKALKERKPTRNEQRNIYKCIMPNKAAIIKEEKTWWKRCDCHASQPARPGQQISGLPRWPIVQKARKQVSKCCSLS